MNGNEPEVGCPHCAEWEDEIILVDPDLPDEYNGEKGTVVCGVCGREIIIRMVREES